MIRSILAVLFIFLLPGLTLVNAVFPKKDDLDEELDVLYRFSYGLALSVTLVVVVGFILGVLFPSSEGTGHFVGRNIWFAIVSLTALFFLIGWYRGAYRWMRYVHPSLEREVRKRSGTFEDETDKVKELQDLTKQYNALKQEIKKVEKKIKKGPGDMKKHYEERKDELEKRLERVDEKLKEGEKKREKDF